MKEKKGIIELYENKDQLICAAIDRIIVEIFNKKKDEASSLAVLLTGCSPLAGTTSTSIGLSIALANAKWKTLLVDCDLRKANQYKKIGSSMNIGLGDYLIEEDSTHISSEANCDDIIYSTNIPNLSYVPCGKYSENTTRILCSQKMSSFFEYVKSRYDYIIFEFPSITVVPDAQILFNQVDGIVLVAAAGETMKNQIRDSKLKLKAFNDKYFGMIINKIDLKLYKKYRKDFDYYFINNKGEQNLKKNLAKKNRKKIKEVNGERKDA